MRNLLQFIVKYSNFLLFIVLEIAALMLLFRYNGYQRSAMLSSTGRVTGGMYLVLSEVTSYFHLSEENASLVEENARLMAEIQRLENQLEPYAERDTSVLYADCAQYQYSHKGMEFLPAKIVHADLHRRKNFLTLNKGSRDGVEVDYGVVDQAGVVGIVCAVNETFSLVMPLVHEDMSLSCTLKGTTAIGSLVWEDLDIAHAYINSVPRHTNVQVGDTVVTSGLTTKFPANVMVGVVEEAELSETDTNYRIRVRLSADFSSLGYVQVVCNKRLREEKDLLRSFGKKD